MARFMGFAGIAVVLLAAVSATTAEPLRVVYPTERGRAYQDAFELQVLELALEKSGREFTLVPSDQSMTETRSRDLLERGTGDVSVAWYGTAADFEARLLPVRIPIARGLLGHRIFLIHEAQQRQFSAVEDVDDLASLLGVQGIGWSDVEILEGAGLQIATGEYHNLFRLIDRGRADYFSRGVNEAFAELQQYQAENGNLAIERDLVLIYPFAKLFFVNRDDQELHDAIYDGLVAAYDDGSYLELFNSHPAITDVLEQADIANRRPLFVDNPLMTAETRAIAPRYWFTAPAS